MKLNKYLLIVLLFSFLSNGIKSQEKLNLKQVIEIGLKNNYDISIESNNATITENNNRIGNAGMLPKIDILAGTNLANNSIKQEFSNGLKVDQNGVQSNNINAGIFLSWTLFDGLKMFANKSKLNDLQAIGLLNYKIQVENTLYEIITNYYNAARQKQIIEGFLENIKVSEERLKIAELKLKLGSGSRLEVIQSAVDLNTQKSELLRQNNLLTEIKINLNLLLAREPESTFDIDENINIETPKKIEDFKSSIETKNNSLLLSNQNLEYAGNLLREEKSQLYPQLGFNSSYLFSKNENQRGFSLLNQNLGLNLGLTASWNIFNGFVTNIRIKNAKLNLINYQFQIESEKNKIHGQLKSAFNKYEDELQILKLETRNELLAKEGLDIAIERFKLGMSNAIELKEIQKSYLDAIIRLSQSKYNIKIIETDLLKLNGDLLK